MSNILADLVELAQFAADVHKNPRTIHRWTAQKNGLPFVKLGDKRLVHLPTARSWILARMHRPNPESQTEGVIAMVCSDANLASIKARQRRHDRR